MSDDPDSKARMKRPQKTPNPAMLKLTAEEKLRLFDDLFAACEQYAINYVMATVQNREVAEDIVQSAALYTFKRFEEFDESKGSFKMLLIYTARRFAIDYFRRKRPASVGGMLNEDGESFAQQLPDKKAASAEAAADQQERCDRIRAALDSMSRKPGEVLRLRYVEQLSVEEIMVLLGMNRNAVDVALKRGRDALREKLARAGIEIKEKGHGKENDRLGRRTAGSKLRSAAGGGIDAPSA